MTKKLPLHEKITRKPIGRACTFCHKKHLQCDPGRPCKNCIKRGVADSCQNVERKRAKYLSEAEKLEQAEKKAAAAKAKSASAVKAATASSISHVIAPEVKNSPADSIGSQTPMIHESSMSMPRNTGSIFPDLANAFDQQHQMDEQMNHQMHHQMHTPLSGIQQQAQNVQPQHLHQHHDHHHQQHHLPHQQHHHHEPQLQHHQAQQKPQQKQTPHISRGISTVDSPDVFSSLFANQEYAQLADLLDNNSAKSPSQSSVIYNTEFQTSFQSDNNTRPYISLSDNSTNTGNMVPNLMLSSPSGPDYTSPLILRHLIKSPEEVYTSNLQPYNYPKAYHALLDYLRKRFNKGQLIQIAETMAAYRPSFIAATRSLVEMDLLFAERSFQRSLLEYESMSSLSSSPTIMWRRTGEVVAVSTEFSSLTSHTKTELLSKRTFIIELMDDSSALDYFRLFSSVAFGDLNGVIITECTLMSPNGEPIRCASTWTVKRDVFDIPMLIVGQFLPILQVK